MSKTERVKEILVVLLSEAYRNEMKAFRAYLHCAVSITGALHDVYEELFEKIMTQELEHLYEVGEKITAYGGKVPTECPTIDEIVVALDLGYQETLEALKNYEIEAIDIYTKIRAMAEELDEITLVLRIEEIMLDEARHEDELARILLSEDAPRIKVPAELKIEASKSRLNLLKIAGLL